MSDERESPGGSKPRRAGPLDPAALMEDSALPASPPRRRKTVVEADESPAESSDATENAEEVSFSTLSTDGGFTRAGGTVSMTNLVLGGEVRGYVLEARLGEGTFAEVFSARHLASGRQVALKILRRSLAFDESIQRRVLREGELLLRLRHPNLVEVYDVGLLEDGRAFVAMELLRGRGLREVLTQEAPLSPDRAFRLTAEIASGLAAAHAAGVVHRDLKPANIFILGQAPDERVKLLDFGLARMVDRGEFTQLTRAGDLIGSPGFMAPEQIRDPASADARADLYALGITAYAMIMGKLPFVGRTREVLKAQASAEPAPLPELGGFEQLVSQLMSKDPDQRPNSASAVLDGLRGIEEATGMSSGTWPRLVLPAPDPALTAPRAPSTVNRALLGAVLVVAACLILVVTALMARRLAPSGPGPEPSPVVPAPNLEPSPVASAPTPRATLVVPVEPAPELPPTIEETPTPEPSTPKTEPRPARDTRDGPSAERKPNMVRVRPELRRALRARGLRLGDARQLLPNQPMLDSNMLSRESLGDLMASVAKAELHKPLLRARMARLLGKLEALAKLDPAPPELSSLEARYFRAREAVASVGEGSVELERLNQQIEDLEAALDEINAD